MTNRGVEYDSEVAKECKINLKFLAKSKPKKKKLTLRDLIEELRPEIDQALAADHTMDAVVIVLVEAGVMIKTRTLRQYLRLLIDNVENGTQPDVQGEVEIPDEAATKKEVV